MTTRSFDGIIFSEQRTQEDHMKYVLYFLIIYILLLIGKPEPYEEGIQNIHIYVILLCLLAIYLIYRLIKRAVIAYKIRKALEKNRARIHKLSVLPRSYGKRGTFDIVADGREGNINIAIILRKHFPYRYHFDSPTKLEYYSGAKYSVLWKGNRGSVATISNTRDSTKQNGSRRLPWRDIDHRDTNIVVFDKLPRSVTDSTTGKELIIGDKLCGRIYLYDIRSFLADADKIL